MDATLLTNSAAYEVGRLSERMAHGYYTHKAAIAVATDPRAIVLVPEPLPGMFVSVDFVPRKDGTEHAFHFSHFLQAASSDVEISKDLELVWLSGSLLAVGDALSHHQYFDRAPELELVRHLRNGIAHGNRFRIDHPEKLERYPAHNRYAWVQSDKKTVFEITQELNGQSVLFDYIQAGDVIDILLSVGVYLMRMGNGDSLRPETQVTG